MGAGEEGGRVEEEGYESAVHQDLYGQLLVGLDLMSYAPFTGRLK